MRSARRLYWMLREFLWIILRITGLELLGLIIAAVGVWVAWHRKTAAPKTGVHQTMVNTRGSKQVAQTPNARQDMRDTTDSEQQG